MELRKDYILDRWSYIASSRSQRPKQFEVNTVFSKKKTCVFCPGNEEPDIEIGRIEEKGKWIIRWLKNKYPAVLLGEHHMITNSEFYKSFSGFGEHEVIIETPNHNERLSDLPVKRIALILKVFQERMKVIQEVRGIEYVSLFKNFGPDGGASIDHAHSQIIGIDAIPENVKYEIKASKKFKTCPFCAIIRKERKSPRFIVENETFISIAPYAPRFSFESWILPKKHKTDFTKLNEFELLDLAKILKFILKKIKVSYNFFLHYSPKDDFHFHFEINPRSSKWAGFELANGRHIVSVSPEDTAKFLK